MTVEEKIKSLIAKALSTEGEFPEEARTCAFSAVRLIEKYKTRLDAVAPDWDAAPPPPPSDSKRISDLEDELDSTQCELDSTRKRLDAAFEEKRRLAVETHDLRNALKHMAERVRQLEVERTAPEGVKPREKKEPEKKPVPGKYHSVAFDVEDVGRVIAARYASYCGRCKSRIRPGDQMWWHPNKKPLCRECW
jgi:regulator of replication initiation timing